MPVAAPVVVFSGPPLTPDEARRRVRLAELAVQQAKNALWSAGENLESLNAAQNAIRLAEARLDSFREMAVSLFPELAQPPTPPAITNETLVLGHLPRETPTYVKGRICPAEFLDDYADHATRSCTRQPAEGFHWQRILAVIPNPSLRQFITSAIVKPGLDWPTGRQLFLRREMEPGALISHLLDGLRLPPITKAGVAESVQAYTERWLPRLDELRIPRNSFLAKLLLAWQLRTLAGALAETEGAIFNDEAPIDAIIQPLRNRRFHLPKVTASWKSHGEEQCFVLHPDKLIAFREKHKQVVPKVLAAIQEYRESGDLPVQLTRMRAKEVPGAFDILFIEEVEHGDQTTPAVLTHQVITGNMQRQNTRKRADKALVDRMKSLGRYKPYNK
ncbi:hypothetical protein RI367_008694 [Sorochytrium milnesiophthora]